VVAGDMVSRIVDTQPDFRGLGRWIVTRFRGKEQSHLSVISAYRPVGSSDVGSSYMQQYVVLSSLGITNDPRIKVGCRFYFR